MGVDRPLAVDLLIKFANLRGESPHLPLLLILVRLPWIYVFYLVCARMPACVNTHLCVRAQVLLAELCPLSGPFVVALFCPGMCGY